MLARLRSARLPAVATLAILGIAVALLAGAPRGASGQTPASAVSVVFAIDNSGSMQGVDARDPTGQRIEGVRRVIDVLRGFLRDSVAERDVRIGAISFGSDAALLSELSPVLDPELPNRLRSENRGATDLSDALCAAWSVAARRAPPVESGCSLSPEFGEQVETSTPASGAERRLVVLITDGSPAPDGSELLLDGAPLATACGTADLSTTDGDEYLCALRNTWSTLTAEVEMELIVIGLDERNDWFGATEAYWQRIVGCGGRGEPACDDAVVRSVDAEALADLILRLFPLIDVCDVVTEDEFSCDVPGGLTSVGFQFTGIDALTRTRISDGASSSDSDGADDPNLRVSETSHVWTFDAPRSGLWSAESNGPATQRIYIQYEPVEFDATAVRWSDDSLDLRLIARSDVDVSSLAAQPYYFELRENGVAIDNATIRLQSDGGDEFSAVVDVARPQFEANNRYEVVLFLPLTPMHEVARSSVDASILGDETPTPTPSPTPTETPESRSCEVQSLWEYTTAAPRHELGIRLGFPLLRFRVPADWSVRFEGVNCDSTFEVVAAVDGCEDCSAAGEGLLPLVLSLPAPGDGAGAERQVSWYDSASGLEEFGSDEVKLRDSLIVRTEPLWAGLLYVLLVVLALLGVSAWSVRTPQRIGDDDIAPVDLGIEHRGWPHPLVRARSFVYRPIPADLEGEGAPRVVMLRYFLAGPLVVRGGSATGDGAPSWWQGQPLSESGVRVQRLRPDAPGSYSPF